MSAQEKLSRLDKFSLFTGIIGLVADTIAIGSFAYSLGLIGFPQPNVSASSEGGLLLTAILGFYFLALIVWFLVRLERSRWHATDDQGDSAHKLLDADEDDAAMLGFVLCPIAGIILLAMLRPTRIIFFLAVFIAFLPTTLWIYTLTRQAWLALGIGLVGSATISQYSTFFAIVLDKFFH